MLALESHDEGVILPVKAQPGSRQNELKGEHDGALKVAVTQVAEKGKANKALIDTLREALALRKSQIELWSGDTTSVKKFLVREITVEELLSRIQQALS